MRFKLFVVALLSLCFWNQRTVAEEESIEEQLAAAKATYNEEIDLIQQDLLKLLDARLDAAKKAGNLDALDRVQAEIDLFERGEGLPKLVSTREYRKAMMKACKKMEEEYIAIKKAYLIADRIDEARAIDAESKEMKASLEADLSPAAEGLNKKLLDASKDSMVANPTLYFCVCTTSLGERVLRATRQPYPRIPNGKHPEEPANPLRDVRLNSYGGEPSAGAVRRLEKYCFTHNAKIRNK